MNNVKDRAYLEIDLGAFRENFKIISQKVYPASIAAVVKADAYGHGIVQIAREAVSAGAACLCVAFVAEGMELREAGITAPIIVFLPVQEENREVAIQNRLELMPDSAEEARKIDRVAEKCGTKVLLQLNIDTGIHRTGVDWREAEQMLDEISKLEHCKINGIYTHFVSSESLDTSLALEQIKRFKEIIAKLPGVKPHFHAANSSAVMNLPESYFDLVRPGLALYGYSQGVPTDNEKNLRPLITMKSHVAHVKDHNAGEKFGYSHTYKCETDTSIALIPTGYADGIPWKLSNKGSVLIGGKRFPIVGQVSMDSILVEVGRNSGLSRGDEVVIFGEQLGNRIEIEEWCSIVGTIPYEILCGFSKRVPRKFINREED